MKCTAIQPAVSWEKIHGFLLTCGNAHTPKSFAMEILSGISALCSFDQALAYFVDGNGKVCGQHLLNIEEQWSTMYLEYYAGTDEKRFSFLKGQRENPNAAHVNVRDWAVETSLEFIPNYIRARGLKYSAGFSLHDLNGVLRTLIALDRTKDRRFSDEELLNLQTVVPHLNNLHKNFFYQQSGPNTIKQVAWETTNLTTREIEVASLLCQGVSPSNISRVLYISPSTTYKHIAHIYEKMHVSSQQELLVRLLRQPN